MKRQLLSLFFFLILFPLGSKIYAETQNQPAPQTTATVTTPAQPVTEKQPEQPLETTLQERDKKLKAARENTLSIALYRPTYVLPFYYTASPYTAIYNNNTPEGQRVMHAEFKAQFSLMFPVFPSLFSNPNSSLNIAYTQLNYWQVYASSQYFRETNYEPEIFYQRLVNPNWQWQLGLNHQSNGRGGELERSWNRAIAGVQYGRENWLIGLRTWALIFQNQSNGLHNPDIAHYLGYENLLLSYKLEKATFSLELQNIESGFSRGFFQVTVSYPLIKHILLYTQYFNGYGQSLIEYNHRTQSAGIGIAFNDWV